MQSSADTEHNPAHSRAARRPLRLGPLAVAVVIGAVLFALNPLTASAETAINDKVVRDKAAAILNTMVKAFIAGDYQGYTSHLAPSTKAGFSKEAFETFRTKVENKLGKPTNIQYMGFYEQYAGIITLFKARFTKSKDDVLIKIMLTGGMEQPKVTSIWFDAPVFK